ncbi:GTP-binding protein [Aerolutibacter ruishenii]|uniref:Signal recognition particle receptor subunit beta n=1 Tax=Aerolutibacter ruishenii TaxID=686800 RepID=A0A562LWE7_9GAMM|nr:ATP/GTP-binding protein [Lysobacter ruishenii]TWI11977.1 hypothetical protein IP93_01258 [Lysobacter ruishenii]
MTNVHKIVFIGEPGAGKTTCIAAVSDIEPASTDVECTDELRLRKDTTTVALDYGELCLGDQGRLLLYGLPGQARFRFMFDVVREGLLGAAVLVDASSGSLQGLEDTLSTYADELRRLPCVIAVNRCTGDAQAIQRQCLELLQSHRLVAPVIVVDARRRADVVRTFELLFLQLEHAIVRQPQGATACS